MVGWERREPQADMNKSDSGVLRLGGGVAVVEEAASFPRTTGEWPLDPDSSSQEILRQWLFKGMLLNIKSSRIATLGSLGVSRWE